MPSFSGFKGGRKYQGGWFTAAALGVSTLMNVGESRNARQQADRHMSQSNQISQEYLDLARGQDERSQQLFDRYMEVYAPQEDELIASIDEGLDADELAGRATTDVRRAHGQAQEAIDRHMARYGVNPADGRYQDMHRQAGLDLASDTMSAREGARRYVDEERFRRRGQVVAMGRNLPATAGAFTSQAMHGLDAVGNRSLQLSQQYGGISQQAGQAAGMGLMELGRWADSQDWGSGATPGTGQHPDDYRDLMGG